MVSFSEYHQILTVSEVTACSGSWEERHSNTTTITEEINYLKGNFWTLSQTRMPKPRENISSIHKEWRLTFPGRVAAILGPQETRDICLFTPQVLLNAYNLQAGTVFRRGDLSVNYPGKHSGYTELQELERLGKGKVDCWGIKMLLYLSLLGTQCAIHLSLPWEAG